MMFLKYAVYRFFTMLLTLWVVSILVFTIINLPPGDYLSNQIAELRATGQAEGVAKAEFLRTEYALDRLCPRPQRILRAGAGRFRLVF